MQLACLLSIPLLLLLHHIRISPLLRIRILLLSPLLLLLLLLIPAELGVMSAGEMRMVIMVRMMMRRSLVLLLLMVMRMMSIQPTAAAAVVAPRSDARLGLVRSEGAECGGWGLGAKALLEDRGCRGRTVIIAAITITVIIIIVVEAVRAVRES